MEMALASMTPSWSPTPLVGLAMVTVPLALHARNGRSRHGAVVQSPVHGGTGNQPKAEGRQAARRTPVRPVSSESDARAHK